MCELLGISFNLPVKPDVSFRGFRRRGRNNPDGWGLAFYPGKSAQVFKEPVKAGESSLFWINMSGPLIFIQYFAIPKNGEYLGTLEVTQDITDIEKIEGEKRLLSWISRRSRSFLRGKTRSKM